MIGSGVFLLPASLAIYGGLSIYGWIISTIGAISIAAVFSKLSRRNTRSGGPYVYVRSAFGDFAGFLVAWGYWISVWTTNAALATAAIAYLSHFFPSLKDEAVISAVLAIGLVWLITFVNSRDIQLIGRFQFVTTAFKLIVLLSISLFGIFYFDPSNIDQLNISGESTISAISSVVALTLFAFLGVESASIVAEKVKEPEKNVAKATYLGTVITAVIYILSTVVIMGVIPVETLKETASPFADAGQLMWGDWAADLIAFAAIVSCVGALNGWILIQGQIPLAIATDCLFPKQFKRLNRFKAPIFGLISSSILVSILIVFNYSKSLVSLYTFVILLSTLCCLFPYLLCAMAEFYFQLKEKRNSFSLNARIVVLFAFLYSLASVAGTGAEAVFLGFILLMSGVPFYVMLKAEQE
ncbi:MAG: amino acid permease [Calditrichaeota bacterium]|nr:amino acid permease [Calditrichota bacterium]